MYESMCTARGSCSDSLACSFMQMMDTSMGRTPGGLRTITILEPGAPLFALVLPSEDFTVYNLMKEIKDCLRILKRDQRIRLGGIDLHPTRILPPGDIRVTVEKIKKPCGYCGSAYRRGVSRGARLFICSGCYEVQYCSKLCQHMDWEKHKNLCSLAYTA